jgi:hypothetical protein
MRTLTAAALGCMIVAGLSAQSWQAPRTHEQQLTESIDCWEPALAVGPGGDIYVVAGRRNAPLRDPKYDQKQVIWRSADHGTSFSAPAPVSTDGSKHYDQRIAVDGSGAVWVSYMDDVPAPTGRGRQTRLRVARSTDGGRTFSAQTVTTEHVSDKPELAVSKDGKHAYIVYTSTPGPRVIASHDGGASWSEPMVIVPNDNRHFWPEALSVAPDGSVWLAVPSMSDSDIAAGKPTMVTLHVFRSTDGGRTWHDSDMSKSMRVIRGCPHRPDCPVKVPTISIAVDARSRAHVLYTEGPAAESPYPLLYRSSADGGTTWSPPATVDASPRPASNDKADHDYITIATSGSDRVCAAWVDDRRGALDAFARCSTDGGRTWGTETLLSDRPDGAEYKSPAGFTMFYGHYGGAAIDRDGRFHVVWAEGEPGYRTGSVWFNSVLP